MDEAALSRQVDALERAFGVPSDFLRQLLVADDWSFVIKTHALLEAAVSQLLTHYIGDVRMQPVFERLAMSDKTTGKLAFVKALELLTPRAQSFVHKMSELRNELVHRVSNVTFSFQEYIGAFDKNQRNKWREHLTFFVSDGTASSTWQAKALENPRLTIWLGILFLLMTIRVGILDAQVERERNRSELELFRKHFDEMQEIANSDN